MKNRYYSLLIPMFMDGAMSLMLIAAPLLALRLGADAYVLGMIGWVPQLVRCPLCLTSGHLSERVGRITLMLPATCIAALSCVGLAHASSIPQMLILVTLACGSLGAFYAPLQAIIGDVSKRGELTKNLGMFNIGWCVGGAILAICSRWLVQKGLPLSFYVAATGAFITAGLVFSWRKASKAHAEKEETADVAYPEYPKCILTVARLGQFTAFFALAILRMIFPQLGLKLGWTESSVATVVACAVAGQGIGMLVTNASPWWRGKLWPQFTAQCILIISGLVIWLTSSPIIMGIAFFFTGMSLSTIYTASLYHGLASRSARGKNSGIHETLATGGFIAGSFVGGLAAQNISIRAPYLAFAILAGLCLIASATVLFRRVSVK